MCEPTTIMLAASLAISAMGAIQQFGAQQQQADQARLLQEAQIKANLETQNKAIAAAMQNLANQNAQLGLRENQEREAAGQEKFEARLNSLRETATARAASGETAGLSVDALLADFAGAGGRNLQAIDTNLNSTLGQINVDREAARAQAQSTINANSTPQLRRTIHSPSPVALGLNIAGSAVSAGSSFLENRPPTNSDDDIFT